MNPDEKLMRSIEEQIGISENAKRHSEKKSLFGFQLMRERANALIIILTRDYEKLFRRSSLPI